jgi:hypothetical protein
MQRLASCLFVFVMACGGGGDSVEDKCVALLETVCDRVVDCGLSSSHDDCMEEVEQQADCGEAEKVGDSYGECVGDIEDASCDALFPTSGGQQRLALPPSCAGALE